MIGRTCTENCACSRCLYDFAASRGIRMAVGTATTVRYVTPAAFAALDRELQRRADLRDQASRLARWADDGGR